MKTCAIVLMLVGIAAQAQSKPEKPGAFSGEPNLTISAIPLTKPQATWSDRITKDGHYVATMDDPNNEFRCDVISYMSMAFGGDVSSFTVVCTRKREPEHEGAK